jgi:DNA-binding MurR/RpiR family transcriptional regulator
LFSRARTVHVAGFRASFPLAYALVYGYRLFRDSVQLIDGGGGGIEMQCRSIEKADVVTVISFAPYSKEAISMLDTLSHRGAKLVAITDSATSPLAQAADVAVLFSVTSPSFFPSVTAGFALIEALLELLLVDGGPSAVKKLERAEKELRDSHAYASSSTHTRRMR